MRREIEYGFNYSEYIFLNISKYLTKRVVRDNKYQMKIIRH